jgi:programmed cell death protein 5
MSYPNSDELGENENQPSESEINAKKDEILGQLLSSEARLRLNNVKMVKPELAAMLENYLIGLATQGKINPPVSDSQLKQILQSIQQPKRDFKINRL